MVRKPSVHPNRNAIRDHMSWLADKKPTSYHGYEARFAEWATSQGWEVTKRGWPDFICRRDGALMAVEVKGGLDDLSPEQIDALDDLSAAGLPTYVYHDGLGLKRWRGRAPESVANLKAEISELHELLRKVIQVRDGMVPSAMPEKQPEWDMQAQLEVVIEWCRQRHDSHIRPGTKMTSCSWAYLLHEQEGMSFSAIVDLLGFGNPIHFENLHRKAKRAVASEKLRAAA